MTETTTAPEQMTESPAEYEPLTWKKDEDGDWFARNTAGIGYEGCEGEDTPAIFIVTLDEDAPVLVDVAEFDNVDTPDPFATLDEAKVWCERKNRELWEKATTAPADEHEFLPDEPAPPREIIAEAERPQPAPAPDPAPPPAKASLSLAETTGPTWDAETVQGIVEARTVEAELEAGIRCEMGGSEGSQKEARRRQQRAGPADRLRAVSVRCAAVQPAESIPRTIPASANRGRGPSGIVRRECAGRVARRRHRRSADRRREADDAREAQGARERRPPHRDPWRPGGLPGQGWRVVVLAQPERIRGDGPGPACGRFGRLLGNPPPAEIARRGRAGRNATSSEFSEPREYENTQDSSGGQPVALAQASSTVGNDVERIENVIDVTNEEGWSIKIDVLLDAEGWHYFRSVKCGARDMPEIGEKPAFSEKASAIAAACDEIDGWMKLLAKSAARYIKPIRRELSAIDKRFSDEPR